MHGLGVTPHWVPDAQSANKELSFRYLWKIKEKGKLGNKVDKTRTQVLVMIRSRR